ncbi:unnamed protein product [Zymoseptoria tritici ST99CH_1A5]|uniref:Uncharacterized protein n=3 Tax=Zymoseptoria tritici TaxID=1047171 RepID=A0A1X7RYI4_ZYMT9|nr:unnamed protein product [Zymoseptoria tritici ST99CH_3D7]SMR55328.1 unnamed protein product [Zymoseptoria tritici ST99CH_1E4]SMY26139.1 unnamed protein product [Zymoseptoria tritici ST99CH_1A5]
MASNDASNGRNHPGKPPLPVRQQQFGKPHAGQAQPAPRKQAQGIGKIPRLAPRKAPGPDTLLKTLPKVENDANSAEDSQPFLFHNRQYKVVTKVESFDHPKFKCNTIVMAEFFLVPSDFEGDIPLGTKNAGRPLFVSELLAVEKQIEYPLQHAQLGSRLTELQVTMKHIYASKTGERRPPFAAHTAEFTADKLHIITEFECDRQYWGTGLAQIAMAGYERAMLKLPQAAGLQTMILSPAPLTDVLDKVQNPHPEHEIVKRLIKSYAKSKYEVWSMPPANLDAGIVIMGKTLAEDAEDAGPVQGPLPRYEGRLITRGYLCRTSSDRKLAVYETGIGRKGTTWKQSNFQAAATQSSSHVVRKIFAESSTRYMIAVHPPVWVRKTRVSQAVISGWEKQKRDQWERRESRRSTSPEPELTI